MKPQIHPLFEIILDNWRSLGSTTEKKPARKARVGVMAEKKTKSLSNVSNFMEKKTK